MTHIVHEVPAVAKSIAIWTLGLLHLLCLAEYPAPTFNTTIWQRRLLQLGVSWRTYTYPFFQHASVVYIYVKMPFHAPRRTTYVQSGRFYIGSTGIGVCKREFNRAAKLKQVHQMQSAHVELAIRYWSQFRNYSSFIMIVINHHPTYRLAWIQEHALLSYFQAPLNFPYITRILQFKSTGMIIQSTRKKSSLLFLLDNAFFYDSDDASEPWDLSQTLMRFCIRHGPQFLIWHQTPSGLMMQPELFVQALYMVGKFMLFFGFANTSKNPNAAKSNI